jgi:hypothetical protein
VRLAAEHDVTIIGVDVDEPSWATGQRFAQSRGMGWPNLLDTTGESTSIFGNGVPVTWFINAEGEVAEKKIGGLADYDELLELARRSGQL